MYKKFISSFRAARRAGAPLVGIQTPDPQATVERCIDASKKGTPHFGWDRVRGLRPLNDAAEETLTEMLGGADVEQTKDPTGLLAEFAPRLPPDGVLYTFGVRRYLAEPSLDGAAYVQAIWNLRDEYKANGRTLVLLASEVAIPPELKDDMLVLDEPLPGEAELGVTLTSLFEANGVTLDKVTHAKAVDAVRGLSTFAAESAAAMAIEKKSLNLDELWNRKRALISATPGLAVWQGGETLDDVGGCTAIKEVLRRKAEGKRPFKAVFWFDEVEKMFAGATAGTSDSSGVSQGFMGTMLTWQQEQNDKGSSGAMFVGPPGAAKSMVAKAAGASFGVPTIAVDTGGMKASLVGESEARLRAALKVMDVVAGGQALIVMTCNKQMALPPELKRRLTAGIFYFDLPDKGEQAIIWTKYLAKYELADQPLPPHEGWTGAEIKQACVLAWEWGIPLIETAKYIVPVAVSAREEIALLRQQADQCFLSASKEGIYRRPSSLAEKATRRIGQEA